MSLTRSHKYKIMDIFLSIIACTISNLDKVVVVPPGSGKEKFMEQFDYVFQQFPEVMLDNDLNYEEIQELQQLRQNFLNLIPFFDMFQNQLNSLQDALDKSMSKESLLDYLKKFQC